MKKLHYFLTLGMLSALLFVSSCSDDDAPAAENEEEIITDVKLTFTPAEGGTPIVAAAQDPDGEGPEDLEIISQIVLAANTEYNLSIEVENSVAGESITKEIEAEADEHMFFFSFSNDIFSNPTGDGNIDAREENAVLYLDEDNAGLPLGLLTSWTTGEAWGTPEDPASLGTFRVVLKHQPNIKSASSTANDGGSDITLTWDVTIE